MLTNTIQNIFRSRQRRQNQRSPAFAAELFEKRLQLSAVAITTALETSSVDEHSYPDDTDGQYPEEANAEFFETVTSEIDQRNANPANAFPITPASPSLELANNTFVQPIVLSDPANQPAFDQQVASEQVPTNLIDAEFAANAIPLLLGTQQLESEPELSRTIGSPENENPVTSAIQEFSENEPLSPAQSEANSPEETPENTNSQPVISEQKSDAPPVTEAVRVKVQMPEESTISDATSASIDEFFASDQQLYVGDRNGAVLMGMSVVGKGILNRKQRSKSETVV